MNAYSVLKLLIAAVLIFVFSESRGQNCLKDLSLKMPSEKNQKESYAQDAYNVFLDERRALIEAYHSESVGLKSDG